MNALFFSRHFKTYFYLDSKSILERRKLREMTLTFGVSVLVKAFVDSKAATENIKTLRVFIILSRIGLGKLEF